MTWQQLLTHVSSTPGSLRADSRLVRPGDVYVALPGAVPGTNLDGADFIPDALARGAAVVVAKTGMALPAGATALLLHVEDTRAALGRLAAAAHPVAEGLRLVGVTGTNGKTTITYLLEHLLTAAGRKAGVLGTISYRWPGHHEDAPLTTPDCLSLHRMLQAMAAAGTQVGVMEVSSHALDQQRVAGLEFDVAVLTNVTQDHLDYHGTMENYFQAKARLFRQWPREGKAWVVNVDDPYGRRLAQEGRAAGRRVVGYGLDAGHAPELSGRILRASAAGLHLAVSWQGRDVEIDSPLVGRHNAENLLAAMGAGLALGLEPGAFAALAGCVGAPGRLERVLNDRGFNVFVDYAHTPDALDNVLSAVKALGVGKLVAVFGCGGNRDRAKRPLMAQAVCRHADVAVLTSDNPRKEDPLAIIADAKAGLDPKVQAIIEPDRRAAIARALELIGPDDALVIAGKGHETYQIVGEVKLPFSDAQVVKDLLQGATA